MHWHCEPASERLNRDETVCPEVRDRAMRSAWWHRLLLVGLGVAMVVAVGLLGASSVRTWRDQNAQQREAESLGVTLDARIAALEGEIARRTSGDGVRREALCFGPYVAPGTEVYAVMGLGGCVTQPGHP